jgi:hypothetical protein
MKYLTLDDFREGMKVTCKIDKTEISDAKLHIEEDGWFICQNIWEGADCENKLGYDNSYFIGCGRNIQIFNVTCLKPLIDLKNKIKILKKELCK